MGIRKHTEPIYIYIHANICEKNIQTLVGGFNPFEKYARQIGSFPLSRDKNEKYLKPPPRTCFNPYNKPTHWSSHHSLKRLVVPHDWEGHGPRGPRPNQDVPRCSLKRARNWMHLSTNLGVHIHSSLIFLYVSGMCIYYCDMWVYSFKVFEIIWYDMPCSSYISAIKV